MTIPDLRPRISDNPNCSANEARRSFQILQDQLDRMFNNLAGYGTLPQWGQAVANWSSLENCIDVNPCDNSDGDNADTSVIHRVYFAWETASDNFPSDPNIEYQFTLLYFRAPDGTYWTWAGRDAMIGSTIESNKALIAIDDGVWPAWGLANGTANSAANGGTGVNENGKFSRGAFGTGAYELGGQGGGETHTHGLTGVTATVSATNILATFTGTVSAANIIATLSASVAASAIVAVINPIQSTDVANLLQNHTKAQVAQTLADHSVDYSNINDHSANDIVAAIADHSLNTSAGTTPGDSTANFVTDTTLEHITAGPSGDVAHSGTDTLSHAASVSGDDLQHAGVSMASYSLTGVSMATAAVTISAAASTAAVAFASAASTAAVDISGSTDAGSSLPPYTNKNVYERLNNSHEKIVAEGGYVGYPTGYTY